MSVHLVSKCGRRPQNEDKHTTISNLDGHDKNLAPVNFYAVYDGHGGKQISEFLSNNFPKFFIDKRVKYPLVDKYVNSVYEYFHEIFTTKYKHIATNCGSTCLAAIQFKHGNNTYLNVLNTGDSRCVLCENGVAIPITKDHKPNWPDEAKRIKKTGGTIVFDGHDWRIRDLSVSRAFGDIEAHPHVVNTPDIFVHKLKKNDKFMILACDGLWDVMDNQDVVNLVLKECYNDAGERINKKTNIAKHLAETAIKKGSSDNVTALVIFFD